MHVTRGQKYHLANAVTEKTKSCLRMGRQPKNSRVVGGVVIKRAEVVRGARRRENVREGGNWTSKRGREFRLLRRLEEAGAGATSVSGAAKVKFLTPRINLAVKGVEGSQRKNVVRLLSMGERGSDSGTKVPS